MGSTDVGEGDPGGSARPLPQGGGPPPYLTPLALSLHHNLPKKKEYVQVQSHKKHQPCPTGPTFRRSMSAVSVSHAWKQGLSEPSIGHPKRFGQSVTDKNNQLEKNIVRSFYHHSLMKIPPSRSYSRDLLPHSEREQNYNRTGLHGDIEMCRIEKPHNASRARRRLRKGGQRSKTHGDGEP